MDIEQAKSKLAPLTTAIVNSVSLIIGFHYVKETFFDQSRSTRDSLFENWSSYQYYFRVVTGETIKDYAMKYDNLHYLHKFEFINSWDYEDWKYGSFFMNFLQNLTNKIMSVV